MANGWERLLRSLQEKTLGGAADVSDTKKPEAVTPEETPQGDSAVSQSAPSAKRTRKTKPKVEQQAASEQDV